MDTKTPNPTTAEKMKTVKAAWDAAPAGPKKDASLTHYKAAQKARDENKDADCNRELDAARHALV